MEFPNLVNFWTSKGDVGGGDDDDDDDWLWVNLTVVLLTGSWKYNFTGAKEAARAPGSNCKFIYLLFSLDELILLSAFPLFLFFFYIHACQK